MMTMNILYIARVRAQRRTFCNLLLLLKLVVPKARPLHSQWIELSSVSMKHKCKTELKLNTWINNQQTFCNAFFETNSSAVEKNRSLIFEFKHFFFIQSSEFTNFGSNKHVNDELAWYSMDHGREAPEKTTLFYQANDMEKLSAT